MSDDIHVIGNMLMISSVSMEDQSRYRCRATNSHGFVEATAALEVVGELGLASAFILCLKSDVNL